MKSQTKAQAQCRLLDSLAAYYGMSEADSLALQKIERALSRWSELEVVVSEAGRATVTNASGIARPVRNTYRAAMKRLAAMQAKYPTLLFVTQNDPRGASLEVFNILHPRFSRTQVEKKAVLGLLIYTP
jgi:hypothetical protein